MFRFQLVGQTGAGTIRNLELGHNVYAHPKPNGLCRLGIWQMHTYVAWKDGSSIVKTTNEEFTVYGEYAYLYYYLSSDASKISNS